jgi:hypothetical protein
MRSSRGPEPETYHLTCPVCGALPGTSCIEDYQELERVHPSRRMSVAERNRRHAATGWEPPELAERRVRERAAEGTGRRPVSSPGPGHGPAAVVPAPRREPDPVADNAAASAGVPAAGRASCGTSCIWFAAYLSRFPRNTAVSRDRLRDVANARWRDVQERPLLLSQGRQLYSRSSTKGRRSSQKLADHLRSLEELGLVRRDRDRDLVIVVDPDGLRRLAETDPTPEPVQP